MNIGRDTYNTLENMVRPITGRINVSGVIASNIPREMVPIYGLNNEPLTRRIEENAAELINASISGVIGSNNIRGMTNNVTILDEAQPLLSTISSENTSGNELVTREYMDNVVSTGGSGWGATNYYSVANSNTNNTS
ncbi:MAG: hypothetical protein KAS32_09650, partial [Candidatus Peribacteraceae bacterium]|nr:hypothetical protein [Candidatus Peribacteraceae bacterium]